MADDTAVMGPLSMQATPQSRNIRLSIVVYENSNNFIRNFNFYYSKSFVWVCFNKVYGINPEIQFYKAAMSVAKRALSHQDFESKLLLQGA